MHRMLEAVIPLTMPKSQLDLELLQVGPEGSQGKLTFKVDSAKDTGAVQKVNDVQSLIGRPAHLQRRPCSTSAGRDQVMIYPPHFPLILGYK